MRRRRHRLVLRRRCTISKLQRSISFFSFSAAPFLTFLDFSHPAYAVAVLVNIELINHVILPWVHAALATVAVASHTVAGRLPAFPTAALSSLSAAQGHRAEGPALASVDLMCAGNDCAPSPTCVRLCRPKPSTSLPKHLFLDGRSHFLDGRPARPGLEIRSSWS